MQSNIFQTNTFNGGMNLDSDITQIPNNLYRYAENVRITTDKDGTNVVLTNTETARAINGGNFFIEGEEIIATTTIDIYGIILTVQADGVNKLYRIDGYKTDNLTNTVVVRGLLGYKSTDKVKLIANKETDDIINVYIACKDQFLRVVNIMSDRFQNPDNGYIDSNYNILDPNTLNIVPSAYLPKLLFAGFGNGSLVAGLYQYCYKLYNENSTESALSQMSTIIPVTASPTGWDVGLFNGTSKGDNTGKSIMLQLNLSVNGKKISSYTKIKIFRLHYEDNTNVPKVYLVSDRDININSEKLSITDSGGSFEEYGTLEELNSILSLFYCSTIEKHRNRLFVANIKDATFNVDFDARAYRSNRLGGVKLEDSIGENNIEFTLTLNDTETNNKHYNEIPENHDCINPFNNFNGATGNVDFTDYQYEYSNDYIDGTRILGGDGVNIKYSFVYTSIPADTLSYLNDGPGGFRYPECKILTSSSYKMGYVDVYDLTTNKLLETIKIDPFAYNSGTTGVTDTVNNTGVIQSVFFRGYTRDEIYRFGIILYNKYGHASPVKWIGDIRMPWGGKYFPSSIKGKRLYLNNIGLRFTVNNLPEDVVGYEIVRCDRTEADKTILGNVLLGNTGDVVWQVALNNGWLTQDTGRYPRVPLSSCYEENVQGGFSWAQHKSVDYRDDDHYYTNAEFSDGSYVLNDFTDQTLKVLVSPEIDIDMAGSLDKYKNCYLEHLYDCMPLFDSEQLLYIQNTADYIKRWYFNFPMMKTFCTAPESNQFPNHIYIGCRDNVNHAGYHETPLHNIVELNPVVNAGRIGVYPANQDPYNGITNFLAKRYYCYHRLSAKNTRAVFKITDLIQPNLLSGGAFTWVGDKYQSIGSKQYLNVGIGSTVNWRQDKISNIYSYNRNSIGNRTHYDSGFVKGCGGILYFGSCLVANLDRYHRVTYRWNQDPCAEEIVNWDQYGWNVVNIDNFNPFTTSIFSVKRFLIPYGGNTYDSRLNSVYISTGQSFSFSDNSQLVYGGDTFTAIWDHKDCSCIPEPGDNIIANAQFRMSQLSSTSYIPFESTVNMIMNQGERVSGSIQGNSYYFSPYIGTTIEQGNVSSIHVQTKPYYSYNDAYSANGNGRLYVSDSENADYGLKTSNRVLVSELKTNNETIDSWTKFKSANYLDIDSQYGDITNLKSFGNQLLAFQDNAVSLLSVDDRSLIIDESGAKLALGSGDILLRYDVVTKVNGNTFLNDKALIDSYSALYWYDSNRNELCRYTDTIEKISKTKSVQTYLNNKTDKTIQCGYYNSKFNEPTFVFDDKTLVFNELVGAFVSFCTFTPIDVLLFTDKVLYLKDNFIMCNTRYSGDELVCKIQLIINKDILYTKVFDNVFFSGVFNDIQNMIKTILYQTKTQTGTAILDENSNYAVDYREDTYRFAIGREDSPKDDMSYPGRLRGKYLICDYTIDCSNENEFYLPYINTTYRASRV